MDKNSLVYDKLVNTLYEYVNHALSPKAEHSGQDAEILPHVLAALTELLRNESPLGVVYSPTNH